MCFLMAKADSARTNASQVSSCGGEGYFTRPKPCLPPKSCMPSTVSALHLFKPRSADHRILRDDLCELLLRPTGRLGWLYRQHHVAVISRRVPNSDLRGGWKIEAHFAQDSAGLSDHANTVIEILVPIWRGADDGVGRTGAQRADDHVVDVFRVLEHNEVPMVLRELKAHLLCRSLAVGEHPSPEFGVNPGRRDHACAIVADPLFLPVIGEIRYEGLRHLALASQHDLKRGRS